MIKELFFLVKLCMIIYFLFIYYIRIQDDIRKNLLQIKVNLKQKNCRTKCDCLLDKFFLIIIYEHTQYAVAGRFDYFETKTSKRRKFHFGTNVYFEKSLI